MNEKEKKGISKYFSYVLRHHPESIDLELDANGWALVEELIEKSKKKNIYISLEELQEIVATNNKKRFAFNEDETKIRASQGHSLKTIDLQLEAVKPPEFLFHGTVHKFMDSIREAGLQKGTRQHVHLSGDRETAINVGSRRGKPMILTVLSRMMSEKGYEFYKSENGIWLTEYVPTEFIQFK